MEARPLLLALGAAASGVTLTKAFHKQERLPLIASMRGAAGRMMKGGTHGSSCFRVQRRRLSMIVDHHIVRTLFTLQPTSPGASELRASGATAVWRLPCAGRYRSGRG